MSFFKRSTAWHMCPIQRLHGDGDGVDISTRTGRGWTSVVQHSRYNVYSEWIQCCLDPWLPSH